MNPVLLYFRPIFILLMVFGSCPYLFAQQQQQDQIILENRQALKFGVGSNLTLTSVENAVFSYKWMTSNNRGYRFNFNVFANYIDQDIDRFTEQQAGADIIERDNTHTEFTASIGAEYDFCFDCIG